MRRIALIALMTCFVPFLAAAPANAQATRTWVSGVGDDANPCSRTAPCKTFAGAISKTAAGGEINCLDSAGFGALTITKAMTVQCEGVIGGVLASGQNGIIVNAGANDAVMLKGLDFQGINALNGIRILAAKSVHVDNDHYQWLRNERNRVGAVCHSDDLGGHQHPSSSTVAA